MTKSWFFKSYAKINMFLHVVGRDEKYHNLESLVAPIELHDRIELIPSNENMDNLTISGPFQIGVDSGPGNSILKTLQILRKIGVRAPFYEVHLQKNIPVGAGLGGSTANASTILENISSLTGLNKPAADKILNETDWTCIIGADTPAMLRSTPSWVSGIGEKIDPCPNPFKGKICLIYPNAHVITKDVFENFRSKNYRLSEPIDIDEKILLLQANQDQKLQMLNQYRNDLTSAAIELMPNIKHILDVLGSSGMFDLVRMTGSGSACFGILSEKFGFEAQEPLENIIQEKLTDCWIEWTNFRSTKNYS